MPVVGCSATAEDVAQEAFVRWASKTEGSTKEPDRNVALLYRIARGLSIDAFRRAKARNSYEAKASAVAENVQASSERIVLAQEGAELVLLALEELPERTRQAFLLRRDEGLSYDEIGRRLGVSGPRAHKLASTALTHLSRRLKSEN